jgi:hypothetical protein
MEEKNNNTQQQHPFGCSLDNRVVCRCDFATMPLRCGRAVLVVVGGWRTPPSLSANAHSAQYWTLYVHLSTVIQETFVRACPTSTQYWFVCVFFS